MTKKLFLFVLIGVSQHIVSMNEIDPQKVLYQAIQQKNYENAVYAIETLKAKSIFSIMPIDSPRTVKQINALNFALHSYSEKQDNKLLRAILSSLTPTEFENILTSEDQEEHKSPMELAEMLFPEQDLSGWLGGYIKRGHFSAEADELAYQARGQDQ